MLDTLKALLWRRELIRVQIWAELKLGIMNTYLGPLWWLLEPLLLMVIFYFFVNVIMGRGGENYHLVLLSGLMVWQWFDKSVADSARAYVKNKNLLMQTHFPWFSLNVSIALVNLFYAVFGFIILVLAVGRLPGAEYFALIPIVLVQLIVILAIGGIFSMFSVFVRDTDRVLPFLLRAGMFLSPVLYETKALFDSDRIPGLFKLFLALNPLATLLPAYRDVFIYGNVPPLLPLLSWAMVSLVLFAAALWFLGSLQKAMVKLL